MNFCRALLASASLAAALAGPANSGGLNLTIGGRRDEWPVESLRAAQHWRLNLPGGAQFDASALLLMPDGQLLTVNDRGPTVYRIKFLENTNAADLIPIPNCFTPQQLAPFAKQKIGRYDCEGLARDDQGRIYLCEEENRWILRCNPAKGQVERLPIDWKPVEKYFHPTDRNASFEGIALAGTRLFVANERQRGRLIVVDLKTLKVVDNFTAQPKGSNARDVHYSDLSFYAGSLYALLRESRTVLQINPDTHRVLAQFDYAEMELAPEVAFATWLPIGQMEGLAVDGHNFWLVTDNNGFARLRDSQDRRPILFRCPRAKTDPK